MLPSSEDKRDAPVCRACNGAGLGLSFGHAGVIQLVECQLPKLDVVGSSPIARSALIA